MRTLAAVFKSFLAPFRAKEAGFASGLAIGAASVGAVVYFGFGSYVVSDLNRWSGLWAEELGPNFWAFAQTLASLFGGFMTLGAGWWAWSAAQSQIKAQNRMFDDQRRASLEAERAMLPHVLSRLVTLCEARIVYTVTKKGPPPADILPDEIAATLKACILVSNGTAQAQLVDLVAIASIAQSWDTDDQDLMEDRALPLSMLLAADAGGVRFHSHNRVTTLFRWAALSPRVAVLLRFSYGKSFQPTWEGIQKSFLAQISHLSEEGNQGGFQLRNHPEYARRVSGVEEEGYALCREDWRELMKL